MARTGEALEWDAAELKSCLVVAGGATVSLTTFHKTETARQVAGLILHQLRRMGTNPADV